ncbi:anthranilate synthase component I [Synechocystis sp. LKSZ1]|uniref:anthranilate synthase component I n=1 Tax=Synechocystis sp. LKSZ1 TaxID=3144951 RepID=UPI00336BE1DA
MNDVRPLAPWYWRSIPLQERTGAEIFQALFGQAKIATLLESPYPTPVDYPHLARYSLCAGKVRNPHGQASYLTPAIGHIFTTLRQLLQRPYAPADVPEHLPFQGGWLGWFGYDAAWEIESLPYLKQDQLPFPVAYWYEPENFAILDHQDQRLWLATSEPQAGEMLLAKLTAADDQAPGPEKIQPISLSYGISQTQYEAMVNQAKVYIQQGDIFQANLSLRFQGPTAQPAWPIYRRLQAINPSPFASYWRTPWGEVVSCSPERLVQLTGQQAQTRPIAGTRPRGQSLTEEKQFQQDLRQNLKERAEHIMLVDLERNDLGRVCQWGSVEVDEFLALERYSHVLHLVSNVRGTLRADQDAIDLLQAMFPGGTITGCPKVRCMEIIEELEPVRRSLFYGSCGYLDQRGHLDLNILIRTLLFTQGQVIGQVGAGIVADSDPQREWWESLQKAKAQLSALGLRV